MHRFFLSPAHFQQDQTTLSPEESHHALHVLRLQPGEKITVFDGLGHEARATLGSSGPQGIEIRLEQRSASSPLACQISLIQAVPKGKNMDLIVQKAVELGAARIIPLLSDRTIIQLDPADTERKRQKWQAVALEACKQSGQNFLPDIAPPLPTKDFFAKADRTEWSFIASLQPDARPIKEALLLASETLGHLPRSLSIMVGPEGDFTPAESALARSHGFHPITLGPVILRTETAALYCLSVLGHELF